ncbi:hypothetical protein [Tahibacter caeni]|uniref:hypothetical protein n=1 Tax=Tahibacter caeni TaxID=1453545 RepID=UPI002148F8FB|nr:hypothetical protein [Tahibacter caeni]
MPRRSAPTVPRPRLSAATRRFLAAALRSGSVAAIASTVAAALLSRRRTGSAASTTNAARHWIWGRPALRRHGADLRHTTLGYAIHHASSVWWALFYEAWRRTPQRRPLPAATIAALAAWVDYRVVPARLMQGFEAHLRPRQMALIYAVFALGPWAGTRQRPRRGPALAAVRPHRRGFRRRPRAGPGRLRPGR